jgi:hypothetical protein
VNEQWSGHGRQRVAANALGRVYARRAEPFLLMVRADPEPDPEDGGGRRDRQPAPWRAGEIPAPAGPADLQTPGDAGPVRTGAGNEPSVNGR